MSGPHGGVLGKAGYTVSCLLAAVVLVTAGVGYYAESKASGVGQSGVLSGGKSTGPMNILVMGLESRTYWSGKPLPRSLADVMHIGTVGGNATNTLILIHIFPGGQKAVGYSIPRDSYVKMYGTLGYGPTYSKIDNAYGYAKAARMNQLDQDNPGMPSWQKNFQGDEAGRAAAVQTVEALTQQPIDHFAELNLDGFYQLAQQFGGIEACVKSYNGGSNLTDANSGANLKVGYQHLNAAQALSFVRERDNLPGGDLDRTARQQAVLDYVLWRLKTAGLLSDAGQLNSLLSFASNYLITSKGWNLLQFAGEMGALSGQNMTFHTTRVLGPQTVPGIGDVESVTPAQVQAEVKAGFSQPAGGGSPAPRHAKGSAGPSVKKAPAANVPPASSVTVDVYNAGARAGTAAMVSQAVVAKGYKAGVVTNAAAQQALTTVTYGAGASANAAIIAKYFGGTAYESNAVAAGHVQVILGAATTDIPADLQTSPSPSTPSVPSSPSSSGTTTVATPAPTPSSQGITNTEGGTVSVNSHAKYGIPCVF
jgi:LCP family protein required for cell wall assembly